MRPIHEPYAGWALKTLVGIILLLPAMILRAQDTKVVFSSLNVVIEEAFREISNQTDYLISVNHTNFDVTRRVDLTRNELSVREAMRQLLAPEKRKFTIHGHHIVVSAPSLPEVIPEKASVAEELPKKEEPGLPKKGESGLPKFPVNVDSLEVALLARKTEIPAEIPSAPSLDTAAYYNLNGGTEAAGVPAYVSSLPGVALRTNLLYGIGTLTPNLGVETGLSPRASLLASGSYNRWNLNNDDKDKMLCHWIASLEYRHWFCERFNGHFLGIHTFYAGYHIKGYKIPLILEKGSENYRYKGNAYVAGISYGYQLPMGSGWNLEFNVGVGVGFMKYDKYNCDRCSEIIDKDVSRTFVAPTKAGISLVYIIKRNK